MRRIRAGVAVVACALALTTLATTSAVAKPADPPKPTRASAITSWQTELCRRVDSFIGNANIGFKATTNIDPSASDEQQRDDFAFGVTEVAAAAGRYLYVDRALGLLPVSKPAAIIAPLKQSFADVDAHFQAAADAANQLPAPVDTQSAGFATVLDEIDAGNAAFEEAMYRVYGHTGNAAFDRSMLKNEECRILAQFEPAGSTS